MFSKASTLAFGLLASVPFADALGSAIIKNKCSYPVYLWTVSDTPSGMQTINAGDHYSEEYVNNPDGGVSMKLSTTPSDSGAITQLEYTLDGMLWYDISNINGYPFKEGGLTLLPSENSCRSVMCEAGVEACSDAYNTPTENYATSACSLSSDMSLILCSDHSAQHKANVAAKAEGSAADHVEKAAPAPAPAPTSVAHHHKQHKEPSDANVMTTLVTQVVTVAAPAPSEKAKRAPHRHHFHHHGA